MQQAEVKYYAKDIPEMPVYINGTPLRFEVLATSDPMLITELDKCIRGQRGGVSAITQEEYEAAEKKKPTAISSESAFRQNRQRQELSALQVQEVAAGAGVARVGGMFARPQEREHAPHNQNGLPGGATGPAGNKPTPDPIEIPDRGKIVASKPPTAKLGAANGT